MSNINNMEVEIVSKKLLTPSPSPSNKDHPRKVKLSCIDQLAPPIYVSCVFYYAADRVGGESDNLLDAGLVHKRKFVQRKERVARMEESLSETLTVFYTLAGRYVEQDPSVDCNDQGVGFLEARVKAELGQLLRLDRPDGKLLASLVPPYERHSATAPLLSVQVNVFECGGFAVGVRISHLVADGYTISLFVNAWATTCRLGKIDQIARPSFDLSSIFPSRDIFAGSKYKPSGQPLPYSSHVNLVTTRFVFDAEAISRLRLRVNDAASRVQLVTGLVWRALMRASRAGHKKDGKPRASLVSHAFNMRGKTSLPVPDHFCGNLYRLVLAKFTPTNETKELTALVRDAVRDATAELARASLNADDVFFISRNVWSEWKEASTDHKDGTTVDVYDFTSWCNMRFYEADFGWGRPCWVSSVHIPFDGIGVLHDTRDGDGIEVWMNLAEDKMIAFEHDEDIVAFAK